MSDSVFIVYFSCTCVYMGLINGRRPAKKLATSSIGPPTFQEIQNGGTGTQLPRCLLLNPSRQLQNLMRTLCILTVFDNFYSDKMRRNNFNFVFIIYRKEARLSCMLPLMVTHKQSSYYQVGAQFQHCSYYYHSKVKNFSIQNKGLSKFLLQPCIEK